MSFPCPLGSVYDIASTFGARKELLRVLDYITHAVQTCHLVSHNNPISLLRESWENKLSEVVIW